MFIWRIFGILPYSTINNIVLSLKYSRIKARIDPHNVEYKVFVNLAVETKWNFNYLMRQEVEMLDRALDFT
jgi:hypothetical protein